MATAVLLRSLRRREFATSSLSAYKTFASNTKPLWCPSLVGAKWAGLARPFSSKAAGNEIIGINLGTTNSCVAVMEGKLMGICTGDLIANGNSRISNRLAAAHKLLDKFFKIRLGRGLYGECLGVRADVNPDLSDEIGKELSKKSASVGLRPIGAVVYLQRKNLKMCLRTVDAATDTSEIAKAYGGGGSPSSSSFIIRMDEYNQWRSGHSS